MLPDQLTIGYPTYMRSGAIVARLRKLLADPLATDLPILVIDNGSTDGTFEAIQSQCQSPRLTLVKNESNIGIVRNLTRLFRECRTEYLLLMSDEDELLTPYLGELLELLRAENPLFVSPQAIIDGRIYRGVETTKPIDPKDFHLASFYISGLVYHVPSTCRFIDALDAMEAVNTAGRLYPLTILAVELILLGNTCWLGCPLAEKRDRLPTRISDKDGDDYRHLPSRWHQHIDFMKHFAVRARQTNEEEVIAKLSIMSSTMDESLYDRIAGAIHCEFPESEAAFRAGALRREAGNSAKVIELEAKLENFRGMIRRRDEKIARLNAKLVSK
jgi:glycosyltransferase involved in cell wall biosynthesis